MTYDRQTFERAWANRPWITDEESDKDRAWRWWTSALESGQSRAIRPEEQIEEILISAVPSLGFFGARELAQQLTEIPGDLSDGLPHLNRNE